jgi:RNA polymerase sigma-70 factor (ECF subfamily)
MVVPENEILKLLKIDAERAVKIIFDIHYEGLCSYAETILRDQFSAEEVVEQLFIQLWINAKSISILTSVKNYLYRSVHNNCLKYIDKQNTELKRFNRYIFHDEEILSFVSDEYSLSRIIALELEQKAEQIILSLPDQCRNIYFLSRYENLSYPEIARKLNITVGTVKTQMSRAFQKLRENLKDYLPLFIFILIGQ